MLEQSMACPQDSPSYRDARDRVLSFAGGIQTALDHERLDSIMVPSGYATANFFAAGDGYPQITVPLGFLPADTQVKMNLTGRLTDEAPNVPYVYFLLRFFSFFFLFPTESVPVFNPAPLKLQANTASSYGFSVIGAKFSEEKLLGICTVIEQMTQARTHVDKFHLPYFQG